MADTEPDISFGATLGLPAAPGLAVPDTGAPAAWVGALCAQAQPDVLTGLYSTCKPGKDLVLSHAPRATLRMDTALEQRAAVWERQLEAAAYGLALRGSLPTALHIVLNSSARSVPAAQFVLEHLQGLGLQLTELRLTATDAPDSQAVTQLLSTAALSTLTHLRIDLQCDFSLPPPSALPTLTHLTVTLPEMPIELPPHGPVNFATLAGNVPQGLVSSISRYIPQLESFAVSGMNRVDRWGAQASPWLQWLTPATKAVKLTSLRTDGPLTDTLLGRILDNAPALTSLYVDDVSLRGGVDYSSRQWGVQTFQLEYFLTLEQLACLPRLAKEGAARQVTGTVLQIDRMSAQGLEPAQVRDRLHQWQITVARIVVSPNRDHGLLPANQHLQALTTTPQQLHSLQATADVVDLRHWCWDAQLAAAAAAALPAMPHLRFGVHMETLTDALLNVVLSMGPHVRCLAASKLDLQSDAHTHAQTPWPWEELRVYNGTSAEQLLRLPNPAQRQGHATQVLPLVHVFGTLDTRGVHEAGTTTQLRDWLASVRWEGTAVTL